MYLTFVVISINEVRKNLIKTVNGDLSRPDGIEMTSIREVFNRRSTDFHHEGQRIPE